MSFHHQIPQEIDMQQQTIHNDKRRAVQAHYANICNFWEDRSYLGEAPPGSEEERNRKWVDAKEKCRPPFVRHDAYKRRMAEEHGDDTPQFILDRLEHQRRQEWIRQFCSDNKWERLHQRREEERVRNSKSYGKHALQGSAVEEMDRREREISKLEEQMRKQMEEDKLNEARLMSVQEN